MTTTGPFGRSFHALPPLLMKRGRTAEGTGDAAGTRQVRVMRRFPIASRYWISLPGLSCPFISGSSGRLNVS
jgi:hypothetical protein